MAEHLAYCAGTMQYGEKLGANWVQRFRSRHPDVKSKCSRSIAAQRTKSYTADKINGFFDYLQLLFEQHHYRPQDVYNMDETGFIMGQNGNQYVLTRSQHKTIYKQSAQISGESLTVVKCISAVGKALKPLVLFKGAYVQTQWFDDAGAPDWHFATSENAWTSHDINERWFKQIFVVRLR